MPNRVFRARPFACIFMCKTHCGRLKYSACPTALIFDLLDLYYNTALVPIRSTTSTQTNARSRISVDQHYYTSRSSHYFNITLLLIIYIFKPMIFFLTLYYIIIIIPVGVYCIYALSILEIIIYVSSFKNKIQIIIILIS